MRAVALANPLSRLTEASVVRHTSRKPVNPISRSWICQQCRSKSSSLRIAAPVQAAPLQDQSLFKSWRSRIVYTRKFSASSRHNAPEPQSKTAAQHDLPSRQEFRRSQAAKRLSHVMDNIQTNIFVAGQRINDLTGYSAIEALKKEIEIQENLVQTTREQLREAKDKYTMAITQRSQSQREVNELLQRKHAWSPQDLERFTTLYRSDHANEQAEAEAQTAVTEAEHAAEEAATRLNANILARYHEEQIWSDKIRRMSTWGTWGLMGVNVLLFLVFQIGVEPWRRQRLVKGFEEKVVEALEKGNASQKTDLGSVLVSSSSIPIANVMASQDESPELHVRPADREKAGEENETDLKDLSISQVASRPIDAAAPLDSPISRSWSSVDSWKDTYRICHFQISQLFDTRTIQSRQVDLTAKFIEGALSSAVMISLLAAVLRAR